MPRSRNPQHLLLQGHPPRVCTSCFPSHKESGASLHHLFPSRYRTETDVRKRALFAQRKLLDLKNAENTAWTHLQEEEQTIDSVYALVALHIEEITRLRDQAINHIRSAIATAHSSLTLALERARNNAMEPTYVPVDPLERKLWAYTLESDCSLLEIVSFSYVDQFTHMREALTLSHTPVRSGSNKIAVFDNSELRLFDTSDESWSPPLTLARPVPLVGRFNAFLPNKALFHCGGSDGSTTSANCYEIDVGGGGVKEVGAMGTRRHGHGGIRCDPFVYVFGGKAGDRMLSSAEKYRMERGTWEAIPSMRVPRMGFNPLLFDSVLYLCGGLVNTCEIFNPVTEQYTDLTFTLAEKSPTLTVAKSSEELVVITSLNKHHWNKTVRALGVDVATNIGAFISNEMVPVLVNSLLYLPGWRGVKVLNLETWAITDRKFP